MREWWVGIPKRIDQIDPLYNFNMGMKIIVRGSWSYQEQWNYLDFHLFLFIPLVNTIEGSILSIFSEYERTVGRDPEKDRSDRSFVRI